MNEVFTVFKLSKHIQNQFILMGLATSFLIVGSRRCIQIPTLIGDLSCSDFINLTKSLESSNAALYLISLNNCKRNVTFFLYLLCRCLPPILSNSSSILFQHRNALNILQLCSLQPDSGYCGCFLRPVQTMIILRTWSFYQSVSILVLLPL